MAKPSNKSKEMMRTEKQAEKALKKMSSSKKPMVMIEIEMGKKKKGGKGC